jgi:hypothetical protein
MGHFPMKVFLTGVFFGYIAEQLILFAVPLIIFDATRDVSYSGQAFFIEWMSALLAFPLAGELADRLTARKLNVLANLLRSLLCVSGLVLLLSFPQHTFLIALLLASLLAFCTSQIRVSIEAAMPQYVSHDRMPIVQGQLQSIETASLILGPALVGAVISLITKEQVIFLSGFLFIVSSLLASSLPKPPTVSGRLQQERAISAPRNSLFVGWKIILEHPVLLMFAILAAMINLVMGVTVASNPAIIKGVFISGEEVFAFLNGTGGLIGVIVLCFVPIILRKVPLPALGFGSFVLIVLGGTVLGMSPNAWLYVIGYSIIVTGISLFNVFSRSERVKLIPAEHMGKTMGAFMLITRAAMPMAGILVAVAGSSPGPQFLILSLSVALGIVGLLLLTRSSQFFTTRPPEFTNYMSSLGNQARNNSGARSSSSAHIPPFSACWPNRREASTRSSPPAE